MVKAIEVYEQMKLKLLKFAVEDADMDVSFNEDKYPWEVEFYPSRQLSCLSAQQVDDTGEVAHITVRVGVVLEIKTTLKGQIRGDVLKKLITLADKCGQMSYIAKVESGLEEKNNKT